MTAVFSSEDANVPAIKVEGTDGAIGVSASSDDFYALWAASNTGTCASAQSVNGVGFFGRSFNNLT